MPTSSAASGLTIRQFDRQRIDLPAEFVLSDAITAQIRFSGTSSATDRHIAPMRTLDVSRGGIGLASRVFVPRMTPGVVRVMLPGPDGKHDRPFEFDVRVRRVTMTGPEPTYFIGVSFQGTAAEIEAKIALFITAIGEETPHA